MIDELEWVRRERGDVKPPTTEAELAARRALQTAIETERPWRRRVPVRSPRGLGRLAAVLAALVVVAVAAVFLGIRSHKPTTPAARGGLEFVFRAEPTPQVPVVTHAAVLRATSIIRARLAAFVSPSKPAAAISVSSSGKMIFVHLSPSVRMSRAQLLSLVGRSGALAFYDWEANALTPSGDTVASRLPGRDPTALAISQGAGSPGAGSMSLYDAVRLASGQPKDVSPDNGRDGPEYFMFGAPGSAACSAAAAYSEISLLDSRAWCYLSGPTATQQEGFASLPARVPPQQERTFVVQQGTVILQAVSVDAARPSSLSDPTARFYVLRDHVALFGDEITNPRAGTDQSGQPDVTFDFTEKGAAAFHRITAQLAHRGAAVSGVGQVLNQHFAVSLGDELLTVPSVDFRMYPDGIPGTSGDLIAGRTAASARAVAAEIRLGAVPVGLRLMSAAGR